MSSYQLSLGSLDDVNGCIVLETMGCCFCFIPEHPQRRAQSIKIGVVAYCCLICNGLNTMQHIHNTSNKCYDIFTFLHKIFCISTSKRCKLQNAETKCCCFAIFFCIYISIQNFNLTCNVTFGPSCKH